MIESELYISSIIKLISIIFVVLLHFILQDDIINCQMFVSDLVRVISNKNLHEYFGQFGEILGKLINHKLINNFVTPIGIQPCTSLEVIKFCLWIIR